MAITPLKKEEFLRALEYLDIKNLDGVDFIYSIYSYTVEGIENLAQTNVFGDIQGVNHLEIICYSVGEYQYFLETADPNKRNEMEKDENFLLTISSMVADKYLSLGKYSYSETTLTSRFAPPMSTLYVYVNFMLNIVKNYQKNNPQASLYADLFMKSISICKCTLDLLVRGFETEALSCWRTLHECECTLIVLLSNKPEVTNAYLKHMEYGMAFRDTLTNKDKQTEIFNSMKEEMKQYNLKSKDIKKYIEYGWMYSVPDFKEEDGFKLNFRDGLEKVAGLSSYSKTYELSSEIIHGTPLLIYSNREYFYFLSLLSTYESFFRLEKIFNKMFTSLSTEQQKNSYVEMRNVYFSHLLSIYKRESDRFKFWSKKMK